MPTCLHNLRGYVPTCLCALNYYVPTSPHFLLAYMLTCLYIFFVPMCLGALNYFVPTCAQFSRAYVPKTTHFYPQAANLMVWQKRGTQQWDPGNSKTPGTPGTPGSPRPSILQDLMDARDPQDLWTIGKLPLSFEVQDLNTVQLFLICCKKYRDEVSHRYGSVVFFQQRCRTAIL